MGLSDILAILPYVARGFIAGTSAALFTLVVARIKQPIKRLIGRFNQTLSGYIATIVQIGIAIIGILVTVGVTGSHVAAWLTIAAVLSAGLSLALDGTLKDIISGGKIVLLRYYNVGDLVTIGGHTGIVHEINTFNTLLDTEQRQRILINNSLVLESNIINHTAAGIYELSIVIPVYGSHDPHRLILKLMERARAISGALDVQVLHEWTVAGDQYVQEYTVIIPLTHFLDRRALRSDLSAGLTSIL